MSLFLSFCFTPEDPHIAVEPLPSYKSCIMKLLQVSNTEKEEILKYYNIKLDQVKEDLEIIKIWISKQPHLPVDIPDDFIHKILLRNKFRVERTKRKLDSYYSLRGQDKQFLQGFEKVIPSLESTTFLPMPKLTPKLERVILAKLINFDPDFFDSNKYIILDLAVTDLLLHYDYSIGVRIVIDFDQFSLSHLSKLNPITTSKHVTFMEKAYSCRILGIDLINVPSFAHTILGLLKMILRPKIYERIKIYPNLSCLYEEIPKECLLGEYGGTCGTITNLLKQWDEFMVDHKDFFLENYAKVSLEHLRTTTKLPKSETFGTDGTFKKLTVD